MAASGQEKSVVSGSTKSPLDPIEGAIVDSGTFKYVQIQVTDKEDSSLQKVIIRGHTWAGYHDDILQHYVHKWEDSDDVCVHAKCIGGGRIRRDDEAKTIKIYGYSVAYGKPDHTVAQGILQGYFPEYEVTWSDEGY